MYDKKKEEDNREELWVEKRCAGTGAYCPSGFQRVQTEYSKEFIDKCSEFDKT